MIKITFATLMNMARLGKMTKAQIKKRLGLSENEYKAILAKFSERNRKRFGAILSGNARNTNVPNIYIDVSYRNVWGEPNAVRYFLGKGRLYETESASYMINEASISDVFRNPDKFVVVCGTEEKACLLKRHGLRTVTYIKKKEGTAKSYHKEKV